MCRGGRSATRSCGRDCATRPGGTRGGARGACTGSRRPRPACARVLRPNSPASGIASEAVVGLPLLVGNDVFAMSELAVMAARKVRLEQPAEMGDQEARGAGAGARAHAVPLDRAGPGAAFRAFADASAPWYTSGRSGIREFRAGGSGPTYDRT